MGEVVDQGNVGIVSFVTNGRGGVSKFRVHRCEEGEDQEPYDVNPV